MINQADELIEIFRKEYTCPISGHPIQKPFIDCEGNSFESTEIENHFSQSSMSPVTKKSLPSKILIENIAFKNLIQRVQIQIPKISLQMISLKGEIHRLQLENQRITHQNEQNKLYQEQNSDSQKKESSSKTQISPQQLSKRKQIKKETFKRYYVGQIGKLFETSTKQMQQLKDQLRQGHEKQVRKLKMERFKMQRQVILLREQLNERDDLIKQLQKKLSVSNSRFESQIGQYEDLIMELVINKAKGKQLYSLQEKVHKDIKDQITAIQYQSSNSPPQRATNRQQLIHLILSHHGVDMNSANKLQTRQQLTQKLYSMQISFLQSNSKLESSTNQYNQRLFELKNELRKVQQEVFLLKKVAAENQSQSKVREMMLRKQVELFQQQLKKMHSFWMLIVYAIEEFSSLSKQYHEESLTSKILSMINQIKKEIPLEVLTEKKNLQHIFLFTTQAMKKIKTLYKIQSYCEIWDFIDLYSCCYYSQITNTQHFSPSIIGYSFDCQSLVKIFDRSLAKGIQWTDILQLKSQSNGVNDDSWRTLIKYADLFPNLISINLQNNSIKYITKDDLQKWPHLQKIHLKRRNSIPWSFQCMKQIRNYKNQHKNVRVIY